MSSQLIFKKKEPILYMIEYEVTDRSGRTWKDVHVCRTEKLHMSTLDAMKLRGVAQGVRILATYEYRPADTSRANGV